MSRYGPSFRIVDRQIIEAQNGWESPLIDLRRFKQGGIQWSITKDGDGTFTGVVNPATAKVFGTMWDTGVQQDEKSLVGVTYVDGLASIAGNPAIWKELTAFAFPSLPNNAENTDVIEITNTRGYQFLRLQWDITTELKRISLIVSPLGD